MSRSICRPSTIPTCPKAKFQKFIMLFNVEGHFKAVDACAAWRHSLLNVGFIYVISVLKELIFSWLTKKQEWIQQRRCKLTQRI